MMLESYLEEHKKNNGCVPSKYTFLALLLYFHWRDALHCGYRGRHFQGRGEPSKYQTTPPKFSDFPLNTSHVARATRYGFQHGFLMPNTSGSGRRWIVTERGCHLAECLHSAMGV